MLVVGYMDPLSNLAFTTSGALIELVDSTLSPQRSPTSEQARSF